MSVFEAVDVNVPIHPFGRTNGDFCPCFVVGLADRLRVLIGDEFFFEQLRDLRRLPRRVNARQVILHFFPHEHAVRADIDNAPLFEEARYQLFDLWINQWFAAANGNHRCVALGGGSQTVFQTHHVLEAGGVFADAPATGAGQIARVQRFKLQHQRKFRGA